MQYYGLTVSLKKTQVMGKMSPIHLTSKYFDQQLEVVREFIYISSTITESLSPDSELSKRIGKPANTVSGLLKRVWTNQKKLLYTLTLLD